ncbi:hypothetical protein WS68_06590 [Burkholderia sp. TSV86]|nr:hypothetical protein WS68_06590 [Burkholderia sp. TSV86]
MASLFHNDLKYARCRFYLIYSIDRRDLLKIMDSPRREFAVELTNRAQRNRTRARAIPHLISQ